MRHRAKLFVEVVNRDAALFLSRFPADAATIVRALLAAEDHRARRHAGIDLISLLRATALATSNNWRVCGVSTIEQQYVRTIFKRSDLIWKEKLRELHIVFSVRHAVSKQSIWLGYLWCAYYGHGLNGYENVRTLFCSVDKPLELKVACKIVACLKYPRPSIASVTWSKKHARRARYIEALVANGRRRFQFPLSLSCEQLSKRDNRLHEGNP
jgi:membrane carboxypeptidase/penicillin-binding protein